MCIFNELPGDSDAAGLEDHPLITTDYGNRD